MEDSILDEIKKLLGIDKEYDVFDTDITIHINTVFTTLHQLGVGSQDSFSITSSADTWNSFLSQAPEGVNLGSIKTYIYMRVRLMFDPPTTSFALDSFKQQISEFEWRLTEEASGVFNA